MALIFDSSLVDSTSVAVAAAISSALFFLPRLMEDLTRLRNIWTLSWVSSLPGTGKVIMLGLQSVSTRPTVGMVTLLQSRIARWSRY